MKKKKTSQPITFTLQPEDLERIFNDEKIQIAALERKDVNTLLKKSKHEGGSTS